MLAGKRTSSAMNGELMLKLNWNKKILALGHLSSIRANVYPQKRI